MCQTMAHERCGVLRPLPLCLRLHKARGTWMRRGMPSRLVHRMMHQCRLRVRSSGQSASPSLFSQEAGVAHCRYSCVQYTPAVMSCDVQCGVVSTWCIRRRRHPLMSPCFLLLYGISNLLVELCAVRYSILRSLCSDGAVARISDNFLYRCR